MNPDQLNHELILRHLDGRLSPEQQAEVARLLRVDASARAFLREVAEQAVMVAELERITTYREQAAQPVSFPRQPKKSPSAKLIAVDFRTWQWRLAAAAALALLIGFAFRLLPASRPGLVRVSKVTGASQLFGANGRVQNALTAGTVLGIGDTVETPSCGAWIELRLKDGSALTLAGHSTLRILEPDGGRPRFKLIQGSLWRRPGTGHTTTTVLIDTPTVVAELPAAQFDVQTSSDKTLVRVNEGLARVRSQWDASFIEVTKGHQVAAALGRKEPLATVPQPEPINYWACDLRQVPEVILGRWLPPGGTERARLGAEPLLWPVSERTSVMLYAAALAAWKSTEHPVLLHEDSKLVFRGRTERAHTVRFGFSAQKIRGVFAGKFEVDIPSAELGPAGSTWAVAIPLAKFRPLQPELSSSPEGLELTDVYALTVKDDAGLEINHIELTPSPQP